MPKTLRKIEAGRYVRIAITTNVNKRDSEKTRAEKKKATTKAQKLINDKMSQNALAALIAENFLDSRTAMWVTLTFDPEHYPALAKHSEYWSMCCREATNYLTRLRRLARAREMDMLAVFAPGTGEDGRYHIHLLIDHATLEDIRDAWGKGHVDFHYLKGEPHYFTDKGWRNKKTKNINPQAIAAYMMHNARDRQTGKHPWHATKNCIRPKPDRAKTVSASYSIEPPEGSEILDRQKVQTLYGEFEFIEYILPAEKRKEKAQPSKRGSRKRSPVKGNR